MPANYASSGPVRVVIVDDIRTNRALIRALLSASPLIEVVGEASDPIEARSVIRQQRPDVITLDVVMPRMDGLSFLRELMTTAPTPVVMVSSRTSENSRYAVSALSLGAVDCVDLAMLNAPNAVDLAETVLVAAGSNVGALKSPKKAPPPTGALQLNGRIVVIGSSTGGVDALRTVLSVYPADCPPTVIAQHMPPSFLESFSRRLNKHCAAEVSLAEHGSALSPGKVYLAPGGSYHAVLPSRTTSRVELRKADGTENFVPSVDLLFSSVVPHARRTVGVMLTGMGRDGAQAMLRLRRAGAHTIVQDSASSVIDGMPRSARDIGAATEVASLSDIGPRILNAVTRRRQDTGS